MPVADSQYKHVTVEEDEEACLPYVYDPTFFAARQSMPPTPRSRSESLSQTRCDVDKVCSLLSVGVFSPVYTRPFACSTCWNFPLLDSMPSAAPLRCRTRVRTRTSVASSCCDRPATVQSFNFFGPRDLPSGAASVASGRPLGRPRYAVLPD